MSKRFLFIIMSLVLSLTSCGTLELKKSANNKLFDRKGFDGGKRRPVYNPKYIDRAKRNVIENNYEEEEEYEGDEQDEFVDPYTKNRMMYHKMIKQERNKPKGKHRESRLNYYDDYPDIGHARDIAIHEKANLQSDEDLKKELSEIKSMLSAAKKDLAKYRCPMQENNDKAPAAKAAAAPVLDTPKEKAAMSNQPESKAPEAEISESNVGNNTSNNIAAPISDNISNMINLAPQS